MLNLPIRIKKPRHLGVTSIHDISLTVEDLESLLKNYGDFIDIAKFGIGTAYVTPNLKQKIELYKRHDVIPYFGGTLFEKFYSQGKFDEFLKFLDNNDISYIEISAGTIDMALDSRISLIKDLPQNLNVLAEVGSKDSDYIQPPSSWIDEINTLHNLGVEYVITEGRNSGTAGIFRPSGELRTGLIDDIISNCNSDKIIFEAPHQNSQLYFINKLGSNVNLGNINPRDVLLLETQRQSLRSETFNLK